MAEPELLIRAESAISGLTPDEVAVIKAASTGADWIFPTTKEVRATVLRWICSDRSAKALVDPLGLRIENAHITETLDLRNIDIEFLLRLHNCIIDGDIRLDDARVRSIGFNGTTCHWLIANRSVVAGAVFLERDRNKPFCSAGISFQDATVEGSLSANGARVGPPQDDSAVFIADRARIRGDLDLNQAHIEGSLAAYDAQVGAIRTSGAQITANPRRRKGGAVELARSTVTGWVVLGGIELDISTQIYGPVIVSDATVGGGVNFTQTSIQLGPKFNQESSNAQDAALGSGDHPPASEGVETGRGIASLPVLIDIRLTKIGSNLVLRNTRVTGGRVLVMSADIGNDLEFFLTRGDHHGSHPNESHSLEPSKKPKNKSQESLIPDIEILSTRIGGLLYWEPLLLPEDEVVVYVRDTVVRRLNYGGTTYWPSRGRLLLAGLQYRYIDGPIYFKRQGLAGPARCLRERERESSGLLSFVWRALLRIANVIAGGDRAHLQWLRLYTRQYYDPQQYDTLAAALRSMGRENDATRVLIARTDDRHRAQGWLALLLGIPYRLLVGNGFRTWWAAVWIVLVTLVGSGVFSAAYARGELTPVTPAAQTMPFQPFVYSLDVLLPIVNLGQADSYVPTAPQAGGVRTYLWVQEGVGWLLATALVASAGAALRRREP